MLSMLSSFIPTVYIQLSAQRVMLRNAKTGETISEVPALAHGSASAQVINPFAHPRSLVSDFTVGQQVLKALLRRLRANSIFAPSPRVVLHPLGDPEGGFTQIEIRALHEMALGAGASEVLIWQGRSLSDEELLARTFPDDGRLLS